MPRKVYEKPEEFKKRIQQSGEAKERAKANMYLTGGQAKLDKNKNNKLDAQDFKILRAEKAKGRGMGLQDESVKPGKVMKAKRGTGVLTEKGTRNTFRGYSKAFEGPQHKGRVSTIVGVKPGAKIKGAKAKRVTYKSMDEMRQKTLGYKPGESTEDFKRRIAKENFARRAAKATGARGKIALGVATAGVAAYNYLKSKVQKKEDKNKKTLKDFREQKKPGIPSEKTKTINKALNKLNKKMGGGMMKRYSKGGGADTGRVGEIKSKIAVATDKFKKHFQKRKRRPDYIKPPERKPMIPAKAAELARTAESFTPTGMGKKIAKKLTSKMGGGMMKKYKSGGPVPVEKIKNAFPEASPGRIARLQTMLGDKSAPMKKERLFEGDRGRRKELIKKLRGVAKATPLGLGIKAVETAKKLKEKMSKKMGGGMMKKYTEGGPAQQQRRMGRKKPTPGRGLLGTAGKEAGKRVGMPNLPGKKRKKNAIIILGENKKYSGGQGGIERDANNNPYRYSYDADPMLKNFDVMYTSKKTGGSVTAKCKLGRNKPTKMY